MKNLLALFAFITPVLAAGQSSYHHYGHAQQFTLYRPAHLYQCLDDTLTAQPLRLDSGQVVTPKGYINHHWLVLQQYINYTPIEFYVRQEDLRLVPYEQPATFLKRRRK